MTACALPEWPDGKIEPSNTVGAALGFTSNKFDGWLWKTGNQIVISMLISKQEGKGHLSALFTEIERRGLTIAVPTPFARMRAILKRKGFKPHMEIDADFGEPVELWTKGKK